jgi:hypothetical protein
MARRWCWMVASVVVALLIALGAPMCEGRRHIGRTSLGDRYRHRMMCAPCDAAARRSKRTHARTHAGTCARARRPVQVDLNGPLI